MAMKPTAKIIERLDDPDRLNELAYTPNNIVGAIHYAAMVSSLLRDVDGTEYRHWRGRFAATRIIASCWETEVSPLDCAKRLARGED